MRLKVFSIIVLLFVSFYSRGNDIVITGRVTDAYSQKSLPGANIIYDRGKGTVTDTNGQYRITATKEGRISLRFQYLGYKTEVKELIVSGGDIITLNISLEPDITQIDQVVVSAGRVEQRVAESTVSMSVIRPQQFNAAHISSSQELITKSPGIEVLDGQASVRSGSGFSYGAGSRVLTLLDGLPILAADAGSVRWQFLPLENISQIEIIKGASSVLYGSSALNGIINFRTAQATSEGRTTFFAETGWFDRPSNQNWKWWGNNPRIFNTVSFSHLKKYKNTEVGVGVFGVNDPGYRRLNHEQLGRINLSLRRDHQKINGLRYGINTLAGYTDKRDFLLWENAETGALRHDESTAINLRSTFIAIDPFVGLKNSDNASHDVRMRLQMSDNAFPDAPQNESLALSMLTEYQAWFKLIPGVNINTGLFQNASRIESLFFGNHTAQNLAAYLQTDVSLGQKWKMVGGFRIEHNSLNGESDQLIPLFRAGINYMAHSYTFLRASYGQGYRYPSIAEKHAATTLGAIRIFPNLLLQPESGWNAELGAKQGVVIHGWDGMVDLAFFYSQNKDLIEYLFGIYPDPVTGISMAGFRADNTEYSRVYGTETEFLFMRKTGSFEHNISGGYLYTLPVEFNQNTGKNLDTYLKYRRKHSAKLSLSTRYGKLEPGVDIFFRSKMLNIDDVFLRQINGVEILPGFNQYWSNNNNSYVLVDFSMAYHFSQQYKLSAAIKNLTNKEYMGRPGDIRPHRNLSIRLSVLF